LQHMGGKTPGRIGLAHPSIAPYGVFTAADGKLFLISIQSDREWRWLCRDFLDRAELADDPRFARNVARVANRSETDRLVTLGFARRTTAETIAALTKADIAFASVNDMAALAAHPHLRLMPVETEKGTVMMPEPAPIVSGVNRRFGPVPGLVSGNSRDPAKPDQD